MSPRGCGAGAIAPRRALALVAGALLAALAPSVAASSPAAAPALGVTVAFVDPFYLSYGGGNATSGFDPDALNEYFAGHLPRALAVARALRDRGSKLVWTTHAWPLALALRCPSSLGLRCPSRALRASLAASIAAGEVTWHASPLSLRSGLLDSGLSEWAMRWTHNLDRAFGLPAKTVALSYGTAGFPPVGALGGWVYQGVGAVHVASWGGEKLPEAVRAAREPFVWEDPPSGAAVLSAWDPAPFFDAKTGAFVEPRGEGEAGRGAARGRELGSRLGHQTTPSSSSPYLFSPSRCTRAPLSRRVLCVLWGRPNGGPPSAAEVEAALEAASAAFGGPEAPGNAGQGGAAELETSPSGATVSPGSLEEYYGALRGELGFEASHGPRAASPTARNDLETGPGAASPAARNDLETGPGAASPAARNGLRLPIVSGSVSPDLLTSSAAADPAAFASLRSLLRLRTSFGDDEDDPKLDSFSFFALPLAETAWGLRREVAPGDDRSWSAADFRAALRRDGEKTYAAAVASWERRRRWERVALRGLAGEVVAPFVSGLEGDGAISKSEGKGGGRPRGGAATLGRKQRSSPSPEPSRDGRAGLPAIGAPSEDAVVSAPPRLAPQFPARAVSFASVHPSPDREEHRKKLREGALEWRPRIARGLASLLSRALPFSPLTAVSSARASRPPPASSASSRAFAPATVASGGVPVALGPWRASLDPSSGSLLALTHGAAPGLSWAAADSPLFLLSYQTYGESDYDGAWNATLGARFDAREDVGKGGGERSLRDLSEAFLGRPGATALGGARRRSSALAADAVWRAQRTAQPKNALAGGDASGDASLAPARLSASHAPVPHANASAPNASFAPVRSSAGPLSGPPRPCSPGALVCVLGSFPGSAWAAPPRRASIEYSVGDDDDGDALLVDVVLAAKPATRLPEAVLIKLGLAAPGVGARSVSASTLGRWAPMTGRGPVAFDDAGIGLLGRPKGAQRALYRLNLRSLDAGIATADGALPFPASPPSSASPSALHVVLASNAWGGEGPQWLPFGNATATSLRFRFEVTVSVVGESERGEAGSGEQKREGVKKAAEARRTGSRVGWGVGQEEVQVS